MSRKEADKARNKADKARNKKEADKAKLRKAASDAACSGGRVAA